MARPDGTDPFRARRDCAAGGMKDDVLGVMRVGPNRPPPEIMIATIIQLSTPGRIRWCQALDIVLRASQGRPRFAGRLTISWADRYTEVALRS